LSFRDASECKVSSPHEGRGMNQINNGTAGMLYAISFGDVQQRSLGNSDNSLSTIRENGTLVCGVVIPDGFDGQIEASGLSVDYCQILAAALFNGDFKAASFVEFSEQDIALAALNNGTVDVLTGGRIEKKYDFGTPPSVEGIQYSTPYYYGNETARQVQMVKLCHVV